MGKVGSEVTKVTNNPLGAIAGGVVFFYATKRIVQNNYVLIGMTLLGVYLGATLQRNYKAKQSVPTAQTIQ